MLDAKVKLLTTKYLLQEIILRKIIRVIKDSIQSRPIIHNMGASNFPMLNDNLSRRVRKGECGRFQPSVA
jgi:hypothetical protein